MKLSVVIPAHNEETFIASCISSVKRSAAFAGTNVEIITVLNRCTDRTKSIVQAMGASFVENDFRNLSRIRNAGVHSASGEIVITIDADSRMSLMHISEVIRLISSGMFVGGGTPIHFDRKSLGIRVTQLFLDALVSVTGLPCGSFWFEKDSFLKIGGFNEGIPFGEDIDFAKKLSRYGWTIGKKYGCLAQSHISTSARKFERFGDWYFFKLILFERNRLRRSMNGTDLSFVNEFFYDFQPGVQVKPCRKP